VLMTPVEVEKLDGTILTEAVKLGALSTASDLHIVQIDEFQLPVLKDAKLLHSFRSSAWDATLNHEDSDRIPWKALDDGVRSRISYGEGQHIVAVPYSANVGLLTVSKKQGSELQVSDLKTWQNLRRAAERFARKSRNQDLFFDFSKQTGENYNCLFLEMCLDNVDSDLPRAEEGIAGLRRWIESDAFARTLDCFHALCRPAHVIKDAKPAPSCSVARQWYLSLVASNRSQTDCRVHALPGTVAVSGEWYLGVWARSAVPDIGVRIILDELTSRKAEFTRLQDHVGLPTVSAFYDSKDATCFFPVHTQVDPGLNLGELIRTAKRRSEMFQYYRFAPILTRHLLDSLESERLDLKGTVRRLMEHTKIVLGGNRDATPRTSSEARPTATTRRKRARKTSRP